MDKIPIFFQFVEGTPPEIIEEIEELFGLYYRPYKPDPLTFIYKDILLEEELYDHIISWLCNRHLEEEEELDNIEKWLSLPNKELKSSLYRSSFPHRVDTTSDGVLFLPPKFKQHLRNRGKWGLLSRILYYDNSGWSGKLEFMGNKGLSWSVVKDAIPNIVKEKHEKFVDFKETLEAIFTILNCVVNKLNVDGTYVAKMKDHEDPVKLSENDKVDKQKDLSHLLPYAIWKEGTLVSNLKTVNIYRYYGPDENTFLAEWKETTDAMAETRQKKKAKVVAVESSYPTTKEQALECYKRLMSYPISIADFEARTNPVWKKKVWERFPIEKSFLNAVHCYDDMKFLVNPPYGGDLPYDEEKLLSSFSGFFWDHATLEKVYLKEKDRKDILEENKGYMVVEDWLLNHFCSGNLDNYFFLKKWITFINCYPQRKVSVATALRGGNGLTKTFFGHLLSLNFSSHALSIVDANLLFGNFTTHKLATSLFVVLEEAKLTGAHYSKFKDSVTGGSAVTNEKYGRIMEVIVMASYLIVTNNHHYYQCDMDDRRIFGLDFDNSYFKERARHSLGDPMRWKEMVDKLTQEIIKDNYKAWRVYLGYLFHTGREALKDLPTLVALRPNTQALDKQKLLSAGDEVHWWIQCVKAHSYLSPDFFADEKPHSTHYNDIPFAPTRQTIVDGHGGTKIVRALDPNLWDEEWLVVVDYRDLYNAYIKHQESLKRKKSSIPSLVKWTSLFLKWMPEEIREVDNTMSSSNPFIHFGSWRNHYNQLIEAGWPISNTL